MSSLIRALSWPLISQSQGGGGPGGPGGPGSPIDGLDGLGNGAGHCKKNGGIPPSPTFQQLMAARRLLCRRYYPEGGWGWVVIVVGVLVHTMTHGLQLSYGPLMASVMRYFGKPFTDTAAQVASGFFKCPTFMGTVAPFTYHHRLNRSIIVTKVS
uniref:Monocarboxylate transporter n=1 Tax=Anopheles minimus TaxID=112268 RepID=A0A182VVA9_9DIPT